MEIEIKQEVLSSPEQQEQCASLADEEQDLAVDAEESLSGSSRWAVEPSQEPPSQLRSRKQSCTQPSDVAVEPSVNGSRNLEDLMVETSKVVVEFADLVLRRSKSALPTQAAVSTPSVPNFKQFRKAHQAHLVGLPKIIGGPDLEVFVPDVPRHEFEDVEEEEPDELSRLFDYRPGDAKRRRLV